jgi:DNA-binding Lrp family transcriptional regulator
MDLDQKIIAELRKNPEMSFLSMSRKLGVSEGTIRNHVKEMKQSGKLKFTVQLENSAFVEVTTNPRVPTAVISKKISALGAEKVLEVAGRFSIGVLLSTNTLAEMNEMVEKIRGISGVIQTETFPIMKQ